jgi:hypothetical protein
MGRAKKFEISQGSYELFFIMCMTKRNNIVLLKNKLIIPKFQKLSSSKVVMDFQIIVGAFVSIIF